MLGIENKWRLKFDLISDLGELSNFVTTETLISFILEFKQFLLPALRLRFKTQEKKIYY